MVTLLDSTNMEGKFFTKEQHNGKKSYLGSPGCYPCSQPIPRRCVGSNKRRRLRYTKPQPRDFPSFLLTFCFNPRISWPVAGKRASGPTKPRVVLYGVRREIALVPDRSNPASSPDAFPAVIFCNGCRTHQFCATLGQMD